MSKKRWEVLSKLLKTQDLKMYSVAEIGVFEGKTCQYLLKHHKFSEYILVDPYVVYSEYIDLRSDNLKLYNAYQKVEELVNKNDFLKLYKMYSNEAVNYIPDESLDMVFIDANHDYEYVKNDIKLWKNKVKQGGIIAGHDYNYPGILGVKEAVDEIFGDRVTIASDYVWYVKN